MVPEVIRHWFRTIFATFHSHTIHLSHATYCKQNVWYVSNRQIHEDLGVPLFADHIRALTASFDSKLADVGNSLVRQLGRYLRWPRVDPVAWHESEGRQGPAGQSRPSPTMAKSTKRIAFGAYQPSAFRLPWLRFSVIFLSCKANARV